MTQSQAPAKPSQEQPFYADLDHGGSKGSAVPKDSFKVQYSDVKQLHSEGR